MPTPERLLVLQMAWLVLASNARTEALPSIEGFLAEQARQVAQLDKMMLQLVSTDTPDLEMERLFRQGDMEGMQHLRSRLNRGGH